MLASKKRRATRKSTLTLASLLCAGNNPKIELFVRALSEQYSNDPTLPVLALGYMPGKRSFYAAIHRFSKLYSKESHVVTQVSGESLLECIDKLINQFLQRIEPDFSATDALLSSVERNK